MPDTANFAPIAGGLAVLSGTITARLLRMSSSTNTRLTHGTGCSNGGGDEDGERRRKESHHTPESLLLYILSIENRHSALSSHDWSGHNFTVYETYAYMNMLSINNGEDI